MNLLHKYEPKTLDDVVFPDDLTEKKIRAYASGKMYNNLLFYGDPGNGKSTVAKLLPEALGSDGVSDVKFINASLDTSIDVVRSVIIPFVMSYGYTELGRKFVILDEANRLSSQAQEALKGLFDKAKETTFILTTNYLNQIEPALVDRLACIRFDHLDSERMVQRAKKIASQEGVSISDATLEQICVQAGGSLRRMLMALDEVISISRL